jgi:hypothetical protein
MPKRIVWDSNGRDGKWVDDPDRVLDEGETLHVPLWLQDSNRAQLRDAVEVPDLYQSRPGYRDKVRDSVRNARAEMIDRACNAWKDLRHAGSPQTDAHRADRALAPRPSQENSHQGPPAAAGADDRLRAADHRRDDLADIRKPALQAYTEYVRRLQDNWRHPPRPATQVIPDPIARTYGPQVPIEPRSTTDGAPPSLQATEDIQAKRDAIWNSYRDSLSNAWKSPVGRLDPSRAAPIERERMAQTFETRSSPPTSSPGDGA